MDIIQTGKTKVDGKKGGKRDDFEYLWLFKYLCRRHKNVVTFYEIYLGTI